MKVYIEARKNATMVAYVGLSVNSSLIMDGFCIKQSRKYFQVFLEGVYNTIYWWLIGHYSMRKYLMIMDSQIICQKLISRPPLQNIHCN